jgi:hypothetical protein
LSIVAPAASPVALQARAPAPAGASFGAVFAWVERPRPLVFAIAPVQEGLANILAEATAPAGLPSLLPAPSLGLWGPVTAGFDSLSGPLEERGRAAPLWAGAGRPSVTGSVADLGSTADALIGAVVVGAIQAGPAPAADAVSVRTRRRRNRRGRPQA